MPFCLAVLFVMATATHVYAQQPPPQHSILADTLVQSEANEVLDHLYNMRFSEAERVRLRMESRYPGHPVGPFLEGLALWWHILPNITVDEHSFDKAFEQAMQETINRSQRLRKSGAFSFDADFFEGAAYGFRGRLYGDRERWLKGAQDGRRALGFVHELADGDTTFVDVLFGKGVYNYFAKAIPEQYPIVRPVMFFFPDGSKSEGKRMLAKVAREGQYVRAEAAWFLLQIHMSFEPDYEKAFQYASLLTSWYPDNPLFQAMLGRVAFRWGQWDRAERTFAALIDGSSPPDEVPPPVLSQAHYYLGRIALVHRDWTGALRHFEAVPFLEAPYDGTSWFKVHAKLRHGMALDALGRREEARKAYREVENMPDKGGSRDRARAYMKTPYRDSLP